MLFHLLLLMGFQLAGELIVAGLRLTFPGPLCGRKHTSKFARQAKHSALSSARPRVLIAICDVSDRRSELRAKQLTPSSPGRMMRASEKSGVVRASSHERTRLFHSRTWCQTADRRMSMRARSMTSAALLPNIPLHARMWGTARRACACIWQYVAECRESYAAAVLYQELSKLSDAELERRGLARCDLHRNVFE